MSDKISAEAKELYEKAEEFIENSHFPEALECLNKVLEINPNYAEALSKLGYVHAKLKYKKMSKDQVFNITKNALVMNPNSPITSNCMGIVHYNKKEYDKAIEHYKKALEINPKFKWALNNMGLIYYDKKDYNKALEYFKKALGEMI